MLDEIAAAARVTRARSTTTSQQGRAREGPDQTAGAAWERPDPADVPAGPGGHGAQQYWRRSAFWTSARARCPAAGWCSGGAAGPELAGVAAGACEERYAVAVIEEILRVLADDGVIAPLMTPTRWSQWSSGCSAPPGGRCGAGEATDRRRSVSCRPPSARSCPACSRPVGA
ncbi:hypothetical protein HBB16_02450 [Pseudonocardia sp. MCCB 268]|nr:hypothetical protein [Pseudonocardia cytotoxica]